MIKLSDVVKAAKRARKAYRYGRCYGMGRKRLARVIVRELLRDLLEVPW